MIEIVKEVKNKQNFLIEYRAFKNGKALAKGGIKCTNVLRITNVYRNPNVQI